MPDTPVGEGSSLAAVAAGLAAIAADAGRRGPGSFAARAAALEDLEVHVTHRLAGLPPAARDVAAQAALVRRATRLRRRLEAADEALFRRLRAEIRGGGHRGPAFRALLAEHCGALESRDREPAVPAYDLLDAFVNGLLLWRPAPEPRLRLAPGMVAYHQTPVRLLLALLDADRLGATELFCDLGSGLGQLPILVNLVAGARALGVEIEPAYRDFAQAIAASLGLSDVRFVRSDARLADYTGVTTFYLYTPCEGAMLEALLARLRGTAAGRQVRLISYGPCTPVVAAQAWLTRLPDPAGTAGLALFRGD